MTGALDVAENPYAVPAARLVSATFADPADFANLADASRGMRLIAFLANGFLFCAVPLSASALLGTATLPLAFAAVVLAQMWLLHAESQSIGKAICGLRIVRMDGRRPGILRLIGLRMLVPGMFAAIPFLGLLFVIADLAAVFDDERRSLHDLLADTRVARCP